MEEYKPSRQKMRKISILYLSFCIYVLGAFLDLYFTYSCSAGVEEILAFEQSPFNFLAILSLSAISSFVLLISKIIFDDKK